MYSKLCKPASDEATVIRGIGKPVYLSSKQLIFFYKSEKIKTISLNFFRFFLCV